MLLHELVANEITNGADVNRSLVTSCICITMYTFSIKTVRFSIDDKQPRHLGRGGDPRRLCEVLPGHVYDGQYGPDRADPKHTRPEIFPTSCLAGAPPGQHFHSAERISHTAGGAVTPCR